jgi:hypothetical protein
MNLNYDMATFVDPKIQIAPRELPVEEMMKVGNVLQDRFDKAMENETKTSFALKKLEESANPLDRETARSIRENTQKRLTDRATNGRYQDMQWQTQQDAMEAASNYEALANRNKEIQKYSDYITTDKGITDPARKQYELEKWMKNQNKTSYDLNNRTLTGLDISAPSLVADVDMAKFFESHGQGIQANLIGRTNKNEKVFQKGEILPNGQTAPGLTVYNVATNTQRSGVTPERVKNVVMGYANADAGIKAYMGNVADYYQNKLGMSKEQADFKAYNDIIESNLKPTINKYAYTHDVQGNEMGLDVNASNYYGSGYGKNPEAPTFTQRPSALFNQNKEGDPFKVDAMGNIIQNKPISKGISFTRDEFGIHDPNAKNAFNTDGRLNLSKLEDSVTYKRLKNHLTELGTISSKSNKKEINAAIVNFWNQLGNAESSIAVAQPGDKKANDYVAEINNSYFGTPTPDANTKGSSILNGQLAQATFTNEKGEKKSAQEVFGETKDRNVRVNGWVNQVESPFEYGSHYMVAVDPSSGEQKHYLIEPDINTKNSGAYFANRIFNSTREKNLVSKWKDGNGVNYEATPIKGEGGEKFIVYVNNDVKTPITLDSQDLQALSSLPAGQANQVLANLYNQKQ